MTVTKNRIVTGVFEKWRERRTEMKLSLTKEESEMIGLFICRAEMVNHQLFDTKIYQAKDMPGAKQLSSLQNWIESKLLFKNKVNEPLQAQAYDGSLKQVYVDRLKEIMEHYQKAGFSTAFCKAYVSLMAKLKGETVTDDTCEEDIKE